METEKVHILMFSDPNLTQKIVHWNILTIILFQWQLKVDINDFWSNFFNFLFQWKFITSKMGLCTKKNFGHYFGPLWISEMGVFLKSDQNYSIFVLWAHVIKNIGQGARNSGPKYIFTQPCYVKSIWQFILNHIHCFIHFLPHINFMNIFKSFGNSRNFCWKRFFINILTTVENIHEIDMG